MKAALVRSGPSAAGETIPVGDIVTIGRASGNNVIVEDEQVSRNHALIRKENDDYLIIDLGSSNGTFVNGRSATSATQLRNNDVIRVGDSEFLFRRIGTVSQRRGRVSNKTTRRQFAHVNLAVLVSDIRNYTNLSEALPADAMSAFLADWFRWVGRCVENHEGSIEKFRGDSVLAYWVPRTGRHNAHISEALRAASDMLAESAEYDQRMSDEYPGYRFEIGCAVHCGEAVLGNIGADSRRDFTTLGDCVNVTFHIESMCDVLHRPVLVSQEIKSAADQEFVFEDMGQQTLKGKPEPVRLYALLLG